MFPSTAVVTGGAGKLAARQAAVPLANLVADSPKTSPRRWASAAAASTGELRSAVSGAGVSQPLLTAASAATGSTQPFLRDRVHKALHKLSAETGYQVATRKDQRTCRPSAWNEGKERYEIATISACRKCSWTEQE